MNVEHDRSGRIHFFEDPCGGDERNVFVQFAPASINITHTYESPRVYRAIPIHDEDTVWCHRNADGDITGIVINHTSDRRTCTWIGTFDGGVSLFRFTLPVEFTSIHGESTFMTPGGMWALGIIHMEGGAAVPEGENNSGAFMGRLERRAKPSFRLDTNGMTEVSFEVVQESF